MPHACFRTDGLGASNLSIYFSQKAARVVKRREEDSAAATTATAASAAGCDDNNKSPALPRTAAAT